MIKSIHLKNFQRHKDLKLELDRVTTIIGPSDSGKSAILRALRFLSFNNPSGTRFIRRLSSRTIVTVKCGRHTIERRRNRKRTNAYVLDGKFFKAMGLGNIPDAIAKILNVQPINFQKQLDLHFWFADTPGQVSKALNQIVNLSKIDTALANITAKQRKTKATIEILQEKVTDLKKQKKELTWVPSFVADLKRLDDAAKALTGKRVILDSAGLLLAKAGKALKTRQNAAAGILGALKCKRLGRTALQAQKRVKTLQELIANLEKASALTKSPKPDLTDLQKQRDSADAIAERNRGLWNMINSFKEIKGDLCAAQKNLEEAKQELKTKTKGRCPLCGTKLSPSHLVMHTSPTKPPSREQRRKIG